MATLDFSRTHNTSVDDAFAHVRQVIEDFQTRYSKYIDTVTWNDNQRSASASGKRFFARFSVDEANVEVHVELKGMLARLLKPKVKSKIQETLDLHFPL
jgi:hypothetical protein